MITPKCIMPDNSANNKRIALNTIVLYAKLIVTTIISFVLSRLVLDALGESDYGLYNVVGGIVSLLNILGTSMVATSYRYMAVEIGKGDAGNPKKVYNTVLVIHIVLALFLIIIGESLGVFYVNHYLNVDPAKIPDALFILHLSLLTSAFAVITVPMNGLIIAREKFVFTSVVETLSFIAKLVLVLLLINIDGNKLRMYAIILAFIQFSIPASYQIYCRIKDSDVVNWSFNKNWADYKDVFSFAIWILMGAVACVGRTQGATMIINLFFGTVLNAAYGIAVQVSSAASQFTNTLRQAAIPQIMKNQETDEFRSMTLVYAITRYSFLCMSIIAIPLLFRLPQILQLWLGTPPEFTSIFISLMLITSLVSNLGAGFDASVQASGHIRTYQIGYTIIMLSLLPIIYILYRLGCPPYINEIVALILSIVLLLFQCIMMKKLTSFSYNEYLKRTIVPCLLVAVAAFVPSLILDMVLNEDILTSVIFIVISIMWTLVSIYFCGLNASEKSIIRNAIHKRLFKSK